MLLGVAGLGVAELLPGLPGLGVAGLLPGRPVLPARRLAGKVFSVVCAGLGELQRVLYLGQIDPEVTQSVCPNPLFFLMG